MSTHCVYWKVWRYGGCSGLVGSPSTRRMIKYLKKNARRETELQSYGKKRLHAAADADSGFSPNFFFGTVRAVDGWASILKFGTYSFILFLLISVEKTTLCEYLVFVFIRLLQLCRRWCYCFHFTGKACIFAIFAVALLLEHIHYTQFAGIIWLQ